MAIFLERQKLTAYWVSRWWMWFGGAMMTFGREWVETHREKLIHKRLSGDKESSTSASDCVLFHVDSDAENLFDADADNLFDSRFVF